MFYIGTKMKGDRVINQIGGPVPDIETAIEICDASVAERKMTFRVFDSNTKEIKYVMKVEDLAADSAINVKVVEESEAKVEENTTEEQVNETTEVQVEEATEENKNGDDLYVKVSAPYIVKATARNVRLRKEPKIAKETETGRVAGEHLFTVVSEITDAAGKVIWVETSMNDWILADYIQKV